MNKMDSASASAVKKLEDDHHVEEEPHVLAVDDNLIDRKLVEKLLKVSSCRGTNSPTFPLHIQILLIVLYCMIYEFGNYVKF